MPDFPEEEKKLEEALDTAGQDPTLTELNKANPALALTPPIGGGPLLPRSMSGGPRAPAPAASENWQANELETLRNLYQQDTSLHGIANSLGRSYSSIASKIGDLGITKNRETWKDPKRTEQLETLLSEGHSYSEIGKRMGLTKGQVAQRANTTGLAQVYANVEKNYVPQQPVAPRPNTWSDPARVQQVQSLLDRGMSFADIAREMGLTRGQIASKVRTSGLKPTTDIDRRASGAGAYSMPQSIVRSRTNPSLPELDLPEPSPDDIEYGLKFFKPLSQMPDEELAQFIGSLA